MKKIIIPLILSFGFFLNTASAQEGAYLNVYGSFGMPGASTSDFYSDGVTEVDSNAYQVPGTYMWGDFSSKTSNINDEPVTNSTAKLVKINLGQGVNFGVAFGYMFNDHFGAELGLGYLLGSKNKYTQEYSNEFDPDNVTKASIGGEMYANQFRITPMLVVSTDFKDFVPYAKFGVVIGVGTKIYESYSDKKYFSADNIEQKFESSGGIAFGVSAVLGAVYQFNKKTGIFLELASTTMSYAPKERTLTAYTINGDDMLQPVKFPTSAKLTEYVDEISMSDVEPADPTQSTLKLKLKYPFSTFAINLGLRFSF